MGFMRLCRAHIYASARLCPYAYLTKVMFLVYHRLVQGAGNKKRPDYSRSFLLEAEATRFELVVRLPVRQFSKLLVSATHPHFRCIGGLPNTDAKILLLLI